MTDDIFEDEGPDLDPQFADALREAAGKPPVDLPPPPEPEPEPEPPAFVPEEPPAAAPPPPPPPPLPEPEPDPEAEPEAPPHIPPEPEPLHPTTEQPLPAPEPVAEEPVAPPPAEAPPPVRRLDAEPPAAPPPPPSAPPPHDPGATIEYAAGEAPDEQPLTGEQPVPGPPPTDPSLERTLVIRARDEAREALAVATATGRAYEPPRPPAGGDLEPPPKRKRMWLRFVTASLVIVLSFAAATTAVGVHNINHFLHQIKPIKGIQDQLAEVPTGDPQTFLLLGSDRRKVEKAAGERGLSDTTILLRVDPDQNRIAVLNIPRDLKVDIPGYGINKFNAAYSFGGPKLTLKTIKQITKGSGLQISHVVNVDFLGFAQAINALGCVYIDVDRRYYHSNAGLPASEQYSEINIQPGYQRLCGADALAYVRYRHTDTDLVRAARQQEFLREARQQVPQSELLKEVTGIDTKLVDIFASHTQSDITQSSQAIDVLKLLINARNAPIKEIHFPATLGPSYVYASHSAIVGAVKQFLGFNASGGPRGSLNDTTQPPTGQTGASGATGSTGETGRKGGGKKGNPPKPKPKPEKAPPTPTAESDGLVDASSSGLAEAKRAARKASPGLPIYYPTRVPSGSQYDDGEVYSSNPRFYHVNDTSDGVHEAYRTVLELFAPDGTHYFGVQGIRGWSDPPAIKDPSESRKIGKLDTDIFLDGDRVRLISWHDGDNTYWLANSLLQTLTNDQMLGMVRSMRKVVPHAKHHPKAKKK